ncbi:unnamed protein product [Gordionus sp. m RMFG-2023]|uniref:protein CDV3 homolog n=1 Tax=Gordionus sp. m RMFG-2023 TaxID=3053472 RepID=UPI0030E279F6
MSTDLDDFFARKDKRKLGKKNKEYKIEIVESENESKNEVNGHSLQHTDIQNSQESDGEWIEETPIEVDFAALNIQNMESYVLENINDKEKEENENELGNENKEKSNAGWKVVTQENDVKKDQEVIENAKPGVYVPPNLRKHIVQSKVFVNNKEEFPSLISQK